MSTEFFWFVIRFCIALAAITATACIICIAIIAVVVAVKNTNAKMKRNPDAEYV